MKKRRNRKRISKDIPAKGRMKDIADQLWSRAIRDDWGNKCAVCNGTPCEAHHLIPRQHQGTRYNLMNGVALCSRCHQFDKNVAPHQNAAGWLKWLEEHHPFRHKWLMLHLRPEFTGTVNAIYYCDLILEFRPYFEAEEFERIVGVRFTRYLLEEYS